MLPLLLITGLLGVTGAAEVSRRPVFPADLPYLGEGRCAEAVKGADGWTRVKCWGPPEALAPGETRNVMVELANPYKGHAGLLSVINMTAELVDEDLKPVPLSDVYVHHYVTPPGLLLGSGAELRGSFTRPPFAWPLTMVVNGTEVTSKRVRMTNIQLINTLGVGEADLRACLECWCWDRAAPGQLPTQGSFLCCSNCPSSSKAAARNYLLEYTVTFRPLEELEAATGQAARPVALLGFDVTGDRVEYNLVEPLGPNTTHLETYDTTVDARCPQAQPFTIVRCTAHQHVGSQCLSVFNLDKGGELICRSCPRYGTEAGVPGNELGYVTAMSDDDVSYTVAPGTRIRVQSAYDGSEKRLGLMGLDGLTVAGLDESTCKGRSGGGSGGGYGSLLNLVHGAAAHLQQPEVTAS